MQHRSIGCGIRLVAPPRAVWMLFDEAIDLVGASPREELERRLTELKAGQGGGCTRRRRFARGVSRPTRRGGAVGRRTPGPTKRDRDVGGSRHGTRTRRARTPVVRRRRRTAVGETPCSRLGCRVGRRVPGGTRQATTSTRPGTACNASNGCNRSTGGAIASVSRSVSPGAGSARRRTGRRSTRRRGRAGHSPDSLSPVARSQSSPRPPGRCLPRPRPS